MKITYSLTGIDEEGNITLDHVMSAEEVVPILAAALKASPLVDSNIQETAAPSNIEVTLTPKVSKTKEVSKPAADHPWKKKGNPGNPEKIEQIKGDILAGMKAGQIAKDRGTSVGNVYQIKSTMKKNGELNTAPSRSETEWTPPAAAATPAMKNPPLTKDEYQEVLDLFKDWGMVSEVISRCSYPEEEIKIAVQTKNYGIYIFNRKRR